MNSPNLENLNLNSSARDIEDYFERFEIWWFTQSKAIEEKKSAFFLNSVGREAYTLIKNLSFPTAPISVSYENIKSILLRHVKPANFEASERAKFHSMVRDTNQGIRDFILQLLTQAAKCNFDDLDMQLKDRLIAGINDSTLQNELLRIPKPTFTEVRAHCEQFQDIRSATTDLPSVNNSSSSPVMFHSTKRRQPRNTNGRPFKSGNNIPSENRNNHSFGKCASCGKFHSRLSCRFRQAVCHKCGKTGHIQSVCRSHRSCRFADSQDRETEQEQDRQKEETTKTQSNSLAGLCRYCPGSHFSHKCPNKSDMKAMQALRDQLKRKTDSTGETEEKVETAAPGRYVPSWTAEAAVGDAAFSFPHGSCKPYTLRVTNLPSDTTADDLKQLFTRFGHVTRIYSAKDEITQENRGFAFISYETHAETISAISSVNGLRHNHVVLKVDWALSPVS